MMTDFRSASLAHPIYVFLPQVSLTREPASKHTLDDALRALS
jgi:hypothetical protein